MMLDIRDHGGAFGGRANNAPPTFKTESVNVTVPSFDTTYHRHDLAGKYLYHITSYNTNFSVVDIDAGTIYANHTAPPFQFSAFRSDHHDEDIYVVNPSNSSRITRLNKDAQVVWASTESPYQNTLGTVTLSKDHVYLMTAAQTIKKLDRNTGATLATSQVVSFLSTPCMNVSLDGIHLIISSISNTGTRFQIFKVSDLSLVRTLNQTTPSNLGGLGVFYAGDVVEFYTINGSTNMWELHKFRDLGTSLLHYVSQPIGYGVSYAREYYGALKVHNDGAVLNMGTSFKYIQPNPKGVGSLVKSEPFVISYYQKANKGRFYAIKVGGALDYKGTIS